VSTSIFCWCSIGRLAWRQRSEGAASITLLPLPPRSPELNPVERLWLYLKERFLSHRLLDDYDAIVDAACAAWQRLISEPGRINSLCSYPWIVQVNA
jgi:transposase